MFRAVTFTFSFGYTPPRLSLPLLGLARNVTDVFATAIIGSMVGTIVGDSVGSAVNVTVGSGVLVDVEIGDGRSVFVETGVGVSAGSPGFPHPARVITKTNDRQIPNFKGNLRDDVSFLCRLDQFDRM